MYTRLRDRCAVQATREAFRRWAAKNLPTTKHGTSPFSTPHKASGQLFVTSWVTLSISYIAMQHSAAVRHLQWTAGAEQSENIIHPNLDEYCVS